MNIGVNTWVFVSPFDNSTYDLIPKIKKMGFDTIEIAVDNVDLIDPKLLKKHLKDNDISAILCGAFGQTRDISNEYENIRKIGKKYITDCVKLAEAIDCSLFSGPVYSAVGKTVRLSEDQKKQEWEWCVNNLKEISSVASDSGVTIGIEPLNRFESSMINLADQAAELIDDVGSDVYKVHIDMFHSNIEEKSIPDAIRRLGSKLGHLHTCENDRGAPGSGHQDWEGVRDALKEIDYDGAAVIESFVPGVVEIAKAAAIWRPLAESQEQLAQDGLKFLRELFA